MIKGIIFDFNRTIYDPEKNALTEGVIELLEDLSSRFQLCLLSKTDEADRRKQISELGLDKYFKDIQVNEEEKQESHFQRCLMIMNLKASEVAVIGDRVAGEIFVGNQLGMLTVWYKSGKFAARLPQNEQEIPDHTITTLTLSELYRILYWKK